MKKIKHQIEILNKNYKRESTNLFLINAFIIIVFVFLIIFTKKLVNLAYFFGICMAFNFYYLTRYSRQISKNNASMINDFITTFSYFRIYISNNMNVYFALKEITNYSSPFIKSKILVMLDEIDEDKSLQPYIKFASYFSSKKIEEVMIAIYEMVNEGTSENYLNQFISIFTSFKTRIERTREEKRIARFNLLNSMSILGMGLLMVLIMMSVINMIGDVAI